MEKLLTVIVPVYNGEKHIERCIKSIQEQTYKNLEIIIINDGSTDNTKVIVEKLAKKDKRIRCLSTKNQGVSSARNLGIAQAKGEYISFVDADDYIEPIMIEKMITKAKLYGADLVQCGYNRIENEEVKKVNNKENNYIKMRALEFYLKNLELCVVPWNKLIKVELARTLKFPKNRRYEDEAIMYKIFDNAVKVVNIKECYYNYICNDNGFMKSKESVSKIRDRLDAKKDLYEYVSDKYNELSKIINKEWAEALFFCNVTAIKNNDRKGKDDYKYIRKEYKKNYRWLVKTKIFKRTTLFAMRYIPMLFVIKTALCSKDR